MDWSFVARWITRDDERGGWKGLEVWREESELVIAEVDTAAVAALLPKSLLLLSDTAAAAACGG